MKKGQMTNHLPLFSGSGNPESETVQQRERGLGVGFV